MVYATWYSPGIRYTPGTSYVLRVLIFFGSHVILYSSTSDVDTMGTYQYQVGPTVPGITDVSTSVSPIDIIIIGEGYM